MPQPGRWARLPRGVASRREAAEILGIHVYTVDRMVKRGELRAVRYASRTMIPITELERLIHGVQPPTEHLSASDAWQADHPTD